MAQALAGIRILDLTRVLAGPLATQILADLGAEVIKVERPGTGDDTRAWGPPFLKDRDGNETRDSTYFLSCNRGKKSVTIDIARAEGQALIRQMAQHCDVFAENFKAGDLARYGLDFASLRKMNPRLVYCSITGYGQSGPYSERPGYDPIAQAIGGLMSVTGERDGRPQRVGVAVVDVLTATYTVIGILSALRHRDATGEGQHLDMALLDVQLASMINIAQAYLSAGVVGARNGNEHPSVVPSQSFACADGMIMLAAGNDGQFVRLCQALEREDLARDPRFATNEARVGNREELTRLLNALFIERPMSEWSERLAQAGVPCGPVNDISQAFEDPQIIHRGLRVRLEHPLAGLMDTVANPVRLSASAASYALPPPLLGEHTDVVLQRLLGMSVSEIGALRSARVL